MAREGSVYSVYLYATVEGLPRWWKPPPAGVGAEPIVARAVTDLSLIASPLTVPLSRTPRTVALHQEVVASLLEARAVIPFDFGTVLDAAELEPWLGTRLSALRAALADVRGSVEMTVRLLRLDPRPCLAFDPLEALAQRLVERAGLPRWRYLGNGGTATASLAFLVPRGDVQNFLARIAPVASHAEGVAVVPTGPWAPYSFVPALEPAVAAAVDVGPVTRAG
jgi:hypothetical protein